MSVRTLSIIAFFVIAAFVAGLLLRESAASQRVTIAAGPDEGEAYALAIAIAEVVERHHPRLIVEVVETSGAGENMRLLEEGRVEFATVPADAEIGRRARMVAVLYPDVFQLIAREDAAIDEVNDLAGKRIALPPQRGGQFAAFWFLADHYELDPADLQAVPMSAASAGWALITGAVDATFRMRAAGNPSILELMETVPTRLVPIDQAAAMQLKRPALRPGTIPMGAYHGYPPVPESDLPTVAVERLLVARRDLDDGIANTLTGVLFERRRELLNRTSLAGFIRPPDLGGGTYIPIHPGAQQYYDRDQPGFAQENAELIALVVTLIVLLGSGLLQLVSRRKKRRIDLHNREVLRLGLRADEAADPEKLQGYRARLFEVAAGVVDDAERGEVSPEGFNFFWFTWGMVSDKLDRRESHLLAEEGEVP
jgi:TRAP transporter TAXI family solute receptor